MKDVWSLVFSFRALYRGSLLLASHVFTFNSHRYEEWKDSSDEGGMGKHKRPSLIKTLASYSGFSIWSSWANCLMAEMSVPELERGDKYWVSIIILPLCFQTLESSWRLLHIHWSAFRAERSGSLNCSSVGSHQQVPVDAKQGTGPLSSCLILVFPEEGWSCWLKCQNETRLVYF